MSNYPPGFRLSDLDRYIKSDAEYEAEFEAKTKLYEHDYEERIVEEQSQKETNK